MKDTMVKSYECPICHEEITAEKLVILPEDEHELHEELLGNIGDHMFSCHEAKRTPDAEQLKARIEELKQELKNQVELHNGWLGTYRIKLDYIEELERKIKRLTT